MQSYRLIILLMAGIGLSCAAQSDPEVISEINEPATLFTEIPSPASPNSGEPNVLTTSNGKVLLSWIESLDEAGHALKFSSLESGTWSEPKTIASGENLFVNWADFPMMMDFGEDNLAAHFLAKTDAGTYAYGVHLTQSHDNGETWTEPIVPHDASATEHGFVSMLRADEGRLFLAWLDGRNYAEGGTEEMNIRAATLDVEGQLYDDTVLDTRACDCCQTDAARTTNGVIVAYRDRTQDEIRDIAVVRYTEDTWSEPYTIHADGWLISGCPVNGPAIVAQGSDVAIAWFTAAQNTPRINLVFSSDEGETFSTPVGVDDGNPVGRVDAIMLDDGAALVSWVEEGRTGSPTEAGAEIRVRKINPDGTQGPAHLVTTTSPERASGFPRMARQGNTVYIAWTEAGKPAQVHTAMASLDVIE